MNAPINLSPQEYELLFWLRGMKKNGQRVRALSLAMRANEADDLYATYETIRSRGLITSDGRVTDYGRALMGGGAW